VPRIPLRGDASRPNKADPAAAANKGFFVAFCSEFEQKESKETKGEVSRQAGS
jgi:hypothetical protein